MTSKNKQVKDEYLEKRTPMPKPFIGVCSPEDFTSGRLGRFFELRRDVQKREESVPKLMQIAKLAKANLNKDKSALNIELNYFSNKKA